MLLPHELRMNLAAVVKKTPHCLLMVQCLPQSVALVSSWIGTVPLGAVVHEMLGIRASAESLLQR